MQAYVDIAFSWWDITAEVIGRVYKLQRLAI